MNLTSEFSVTRYTAKLGIETDTWRWMPDDPRSQKLYASGYLQEHVPDVAADFVAQAENAVVWIVTNMAGGYDVLFDEREDAVQATREQKLDILDGFFWIGSTSTIREPPELTAAGDAFWARQDHVDPDGDGWVTEEVFYATLADALTWAAALREEGRAAQLLSTQIVWDEKADRYKRLGWTDADVIAEFGPRPTGGS